MRDDDPIEELFRRTDPARTPSDAPLTAAQLALRDRIASADAARAGSGRRRGWAWTAAIALPLAAAATVVTLVTAGVLTAAPAAAYGPRPLAVQPVGESTQDTVAALVDTLGSSPVADDQRHATFDQWALQIDDSGTPQQSSAIQASIVGLEWRPDLSGRLVITASEPYFADGAPGTPQTDTGFAPGTVISDDRFAAGEYQPGLPDLSILDAPGSEVLASLGLAADAHAGDLAFVVMLAQNEWTPSPAHTARLLSLLAAREGFSLAGSTTDRLGRDALAFTLDSTAQPHRSWILLTSPTSGRIIGLEEHTIGDDPALGVPPETVTQYFAWH